MAGDDDRYISRGFRPGSYDNFGGYFIGPDIFPRPYFGMALCPNKVFTGAYPVPWVSQRLLRDHGGNTELNADR
jgi:hypothetical protein